MSAKSSMMEQVSNFQNRILSQISKAVNMSVFSALAVILVSQVGHATAANCGAYDTSYGPLRFQRRVYQNQCWLQVDPVDDTLLTYRDYLVMDDGGLLVFNSYGDGDESTHTGGRMFYTFPRDRNPDVQQDTSGLTLYTATSLVVFQMDKASGMVTAVSNGTVTEDSAIVATNEGGLHITSLDTVWLDTGFQLGSDPRTDSKRSSVFHDRKGASCSVVNSTIFNYSSSDIVLKFDDKGLAQFLANSCPKLEVNF